jgi:hypothetical protein
MLERFFLKPFVAQALVVQAANGQAGASPPLRMARRQM